jgi:soluble lytic murein transglycosylase-like protein
MARPRVKPELDLLIAVLSRHYGVDPHLVRAVVEVESNFNPRAKSPKGATGLMQLMPTTAARYHKENLYDPVKNIEAGVLYLRDLLKLFGGDTELALAGYNAGEGAVLKHKRRIPPYAETQQYVPKVIAAWNRNRADPNLPRLSAQGVRLQ